MLEMTEFAETPQFDYETWRALVHSYYGGDAKASEPQAFAGWMRPLSVCGLGAAANRVECTHATETHVAGAYQVERSYQDVRRAGADEFRALFLLAGRSIVRQNDQAVELAQGDVLLLDASRPSICSMNRSGRWVSLHLPRQPLISHLGFEPEGGLCGRSGTVATRMLYQLIQDGIEDEAELPKPDHAFMQLAVYNLFGAIFNRSATSLRPTDRLFKRICSMVKHRFADPDFSPGDVAAEAGISPRYLQKLFAERGLTCGHFIQSLRLDHAALLLQRRSSLNTGQPISEIAYACGFRDYPFFARKFRHRFGYPPGAHANKGPRPNNLHPPDRV